MTVLPKPSLLVRAQPRAGFTLIEMLVVVGIIVVLAGLLIPMAVRSYRTAGVTRARADLQAIAIALDAYKADLGDYPRFDDDNGGPLNLMGNRGAVLLCRALVGPTPQTSTTTSGLGDGADGPGFRVRPGGGGRVYGPYVDVGKFKLGGSDTTQFTDAVLLDRYGNPILYYPATPGAQPSTAAGTYVVDIAPPGYGTAATYHPLYNAIDNKSSLSVATLQGLMKANTNGSLMSTAVYGGPYLLWTAGPDGVFGTDPTGKSDDVCNFDLPADVRK